MAIRDVPLDLIDDNPYNPRKYYAPVKIKEMADSLHKVGMRQGVEGRQLDGRVQLAYGHMRLRGYRDNQKHQAAGNWATMPVDVKELSDRDMFDFALEENLRRTEIKPIEVARCIQSFSGVFPEVTEKTIGEKHGMTEANVSNMLRVLRLPEKFLDKIDEGIISFTQGRELLTLEGIPDAEELMSAAVNGLKTGNKQFGHPNTVEGLQKSIHDAINAKFPPLEKGHGSWRYNLLFDSRAAGCLKCAKSVVTHLTKSQVAHYCTDEECWKQKTEEHKVKAAAAAKSRMKAEVLERAAKDVAQRTPEPAADISQEKSEPAVPELTLEKRGTSWIAIDGQGRIIAVRQEKKVAEESAKASFEPVATVVDPKPEEFVLNHTYRIVTKPGIDCPHFDVTAQNLTIAVEALGLKSADVELAKVHKSSGKIGTGGDVSAGWSKCTESLDDLGPAVEEQLEAQADERDRQLEEVRERANLERPVGELPCETCANEPTCGREDFRVSGDGDDRYICDEWLPHKAICQVPTETKTIPADIMEQARAAAGTRAEVLDLNDIGDGSQYSRYMKQGYALLSDEVKHIDDPEECLERCTRGFHYAFDSKYPGEKEIFVCSDPKCLAQKKGTLTRKKNAAGQARKNAEREAIRQAIDHVGQVAELLATHVQGITAVAGIKAPAIAVTRPFLELIIYNQLHGKQVATYYDSDRGKAPEKWLWDKLNAGIPAEKRTEPELWKLIRILSDAGLVKLIVEYMFYYLADHGDTGSYQIKTELPLRWLGVDLKMESKEEVVNVR